PAVRARSEEHTSELQSRLQLVCRLLLEKKKQTDTPPGAHPKPLGASARAGVHRLRCHSSHSSFFFNDTATTEIYTLSLHDALPIYPAVRACRWLGKRGCRSRSARTPIRPAKSERSEEHTSELQSRLHLVCRLL